MTTTEVCGTRHRLREIQQNFSEVAKSLEDASPRFTNLTKPEILDLPRMKKALDPGTLALLFDVGEERVHLFAISQDAPMRLVTLPLRQADLRSEIKAMLRLVHDSASESSVATLDRRKLTGLSARLYKDLLGPVDDLVEKSQRLLIIPDGPLHLLPWGLLTRQEPEAGHRRFLLERKPVHVSLSITVYEQIQRLRTRATLQPEGTLSLAAFGDPLFVFGEQALPSDVEPRVRSLASRGFHFATLAASRGEVERIASLFPVLTRTFLGSEATEENAKALPRSTRIVHFATHATLDEVSPLDSAVVLSIPERFEEGRENGLLQVWEIFEQVRLDADLVVLSACESGLGKEMGGEGLIGLTRAFQYAGAKSVMASLWKISDRTTAELMVRFYRHLKEGLPKDEALRAAQIELIRGPIKVKDEQGEEVEFDASAPYYWAAFQIYGDWQ